MWPKVLKQTGRRVLPTTCQWWGCSEAAAQHSSGKAWAVCLTWGTIRIV